MSTPFIQRVLVKNYKSIGLADVKLSGLTFLVGPNGGGKSNFLDVFHFVADALNLTLDHAIHARGGIKDVIRRPVRLVTGPILIYFEFVLPDGTRGSYRVEISRVENDSFVVDREDCYLFGSQEKHCYAIEKGTVTVDTTGVLPEPFPDRLHLVVASSLRPFRAVYENLRRMAVYYLYPDGIRATHPAASTDLLEPDGSNLATVLSKLPGSARTAIQEYLQQLIPQVQAIETESISGKKTVALRQWDHDGRNRLKLPAHNISDGTIRVLAILVALFQETKTTTTPFPLVAIEQPEMGLHPTCTDLLFDAVFTASNHRQIIVTSHSSEILTNNKVPTESLQVVDIVQGASVIVPLDDGNRSILQDRLLGAGELLRLSQLTPSDAMCLPPGRRVGPTEDAPPQTA